MNLMAIFMWVWIYLVACGLIAVALRETDYFYNRPYLRILVGLLWPLFALLLPVILFNESRK